MRGLSFLLLAIAFPASAQVFKCTEGSKVVFSDYPCQRTDNKTIDVRPAAGGPVNRSSEYWDAQRQKEEQAAAEIRAQYEREANEEAKRREANRREYEREASEAAKRSEARRQQYEREENEAAKQREAKRQEHEAMLSTFTPKAKFDCDYSRSEKADALKMRDLFSQYVALADVALMAPRIGLASPRLKLAELEPAIHQFRFQTECLINLQRNARAYTKTVGVMLRGFASGSAISPRDADDATRFLGNYMSGLSLYRVAN